MLILCWDQSPDQRFPAIPSGHSNKMVRCLRRCNPYPCPLLHYTHHCYFPLAPTTLQKQTIPHCRSTPCVFQWQRSAFTPPGLLNPNRFSSHGLSDHGSHLGAMAASPMGRGAAPSCKHAATLHALALPHTARASLKVITLGTVQISPGRCHWGSLNKKYHCSSYFYSSCETGEVRSTKAIAPGALGLACLLLV